MAGVRCVQCDVTLQGVRQDLVNVALLIAAYRAVRKGNADGSCLPVDARRLHEGSPELEQIGPFSRILGRRDLPIGAVHERVRTITENPAAAYFRGVQLLS